MAFGLVGDKQRSKNLPMTLLVARIVMTVYQVKHVEVKGTLFEDLCELLGDNSKSKQLLEYKSHRFLGLTKVIRRILEKNRSLEEWYDERWAKAEREDKVLPTPFPLAGYKTELMQILSLLHPINVLNKTSQADAANQADVLLRLFKLYWIARDHSETIEAQ